MLLQAVAWDTSERMAALRLAMPPWLDHLSSCRMRLLTRRGTRSDTP